MIKLVGIHKIYEDGNNGFLALKDINLDFKDDHFVCVLGKSGSGKTTLLNIIGGLDKPSTGHMVINGDLTTKFTRTQWDYFRNYKIGFIFQNYSLIEHLTVLDNVMLSIKLQGIGKEEAKKRALDILERVHILDQAEKIPKKLSGGQRQRVAIARALVNNPDVILADEPTGNLDKKTSDEILALLREISQDKLVVMVTHSKKIANKYADRIIELKDGSVVSDTKPYLNERVHILKPKIKNTRFTFIDKIKHSFKNIRMKFWRSFLISLGLAIGVSSYILIDGISNGVKINVKRMIAQEQVSPDFRFYVEDEELEHLNKDSDEYIEYLLEDNAIKAVRYERQLNLQVFEVEGKSVSNQWVNLSYKFTDFNQEDEKFVGKPYKDGRWPESDNEIMLSYRFANNLYNIENMNIIWERLNGINIEMVSEYYYHIPYEVYETNLGYCTAYPFIDEETPPVGYDASTFGSYQDQIAMQIDYYNTLIRNGDNIYFCKNYDELSNYYSREVKETKEYTVVGINHATYINHSFITKEEYMNVPNLDNIELDDPNHQFLVYLNEYGKEHTFDIKVNYPEAIKHEVPQSLDSSSIIDVSVEIIQFIIGLILVVSVITAGLMLLMVLLISVLERSREIGILRSLGATRSDILSVFVSESAVLGFFAGIIGILISIIGTIGGNLYIKYYFDTDVNWIVLKPISCVFAVIISILFAMLCGLVPAIKASNKTPINALKRL